MLRAVSPACETLLKVTLTGLVELPVSKGFTVTFAPVGVFGCPQFEGDNNCV